MLKIVAITWSLLSVQSIFICQVLILIWFWSLFIWTGLYGHKVLSQIIYMHDIEVRIRGSFPTCMHLENTENWRKISAFQFFLSCSRHEKLQEAGDDSSSDLHDRQTFCKKPPSGLFQKLLKFYAHLTPPPHPLHKS